MRVTVLGCGSSGGVPLVGNVWGACDPWNPKNRRRRPAILIETGTEAGQGATILVDAGADLREQLLAAEVRRIDAVIITHSHADHCHGLDDLRPLVYARGRTIPLYSDRDTLKDLKARFAYIFEGAYGYPPLLDAQEIPQHGGFEAAGMAFQTFTQWHGEVTTLGLRFGAVAYSPDVSDLPDKAFDYLDNLQLWIVDALRDDPHPSHAHYARTLEWIARVKPARAILTHMNHMADYETWRARCPKGVEPGYDGLTVEIAAEAV